LERNSMQAADARGRISLWGRVGNQYTGN